MSLRLPAAAGMLVAAATVTIAAQQVFRGGVEVVSLSVTVSDKEGRFLSGLDQKNFQVFEDGVMQELLYFSREHQPISLTLLIDTSTSMEHKIGIAQEAAVGFVRQLKAGDVASVIEFDSRVEILQDFTGDKNLLEGAIRRSAVGGSTSLYNAIYQGLGLMRQAHRGTEPGTIRRRAMVLLSDGEDTTSVLAYEDVIDGAKRSDAAVYTIGLRSREDSPSKGFREAEFVLRTLAQQTGGREFFVDDVRELPSIYQRIADELSNQYAMGYSSKNQRRDGGWRRIVVRTDVPNTIARAKQGYYAPGGSK